MSRRTGWYGESLDPGPDVSGGLGAHEAESEYCACSQPKKRPEDRQCPGCQAADDSDRHHEQRRDREVGL